MNIDDGSLPLISSSEYNKAPFNDEDKAIKTYDITVSMSMSKDFKIDLSQEDLDNISCQNDLIDLVKNRICLPDEAHMYVNMKDKKKDLEDWCVDDINIDI